jgi:hypothetical protein
MGIAASAGLQAAVKTEYVIAHCPNCQNPFGPSGESHPAGVFLCHGGLAAHQDALISALAAA